MASTIVIPLKETNGLETQHLLFMWGERKHSCSSAILSPLPRRSWEHSLSLISFSAPFLAPAFGSLATWWVKAQHSLARVLLAVFRPDGLKRCHWGCGMESVRGTRSPVRGRQAEQWSNQVRTCWTHEGHGCRSGGERTYLGDLMGVEWTGCWLDVEGEGERRRGTDTEISGLATFIEVAPGTRGCAGQDEWDHGKSSECGFSTS